MLRDSSISFYNVSSLAIKWLKDWNRAERGAASILRLKKPFNILLKYAQRDTFIIFSFNNSKYKRRLGNHNYIYIHLYRKHIYRVNVFLFTYNCFWFSPFAVRHAADKLHSPSIFQRHHVDFFTRKRKREYKDEWKRRKFGILIAAYRKIPPLKSFRNKYIIRGQFHTIYFATGINNKKTRCWNNRIKRLNFLIINE